MKGKKSDIFQGLKLCCRVLNLRKHIVTLGGGHQYFTAWTLDANLEELIIDVIALQLECKVFGDERCDEHSEHITCEKNWFL